MTQLGPENKDIYEVEVKDGNRLGRRLSRGLRSLSRSVGNTARSGLITEPFDPNAYDGDGDNIIQDGTQWQRPAVLRSQSVPKPDLPEAPQVGTETETEKTQKETRKLVEAAERAGTRISPERSRVAVGTLRSSTETPLLDPEWRRTATPRELAEVIVPNTLAEADELAEQISVPRSAYDNEADYQNALKLYRRTRDAERLVAKRRMEAVVGTYERKHPKTTKPGSFERDIRDDHIEWDKNLKKIFGDQSEWAKQIGADGKRGTIQTQFEFLTEYLQELSRDPVKNAEIIKLIAEVIAAFQSGQFPTHGAFWYTDNGRPQHFPLSPVEYILSRLFMEHANNPQEFLTIGDVRGSVTPSGDADVVLGWATHFLDEYQKFYEARKGPRALSKQQIKNRLETAMLSGSRAGFFGTLFAGRHKPNHHYAAAHSMEMSDDPRDFVLLRALLQRTLEENPEFLEAVRQFGHPPIYVPHRAFHFVAPPREFQEKFLLVPESELTPSELRDKLISGKEYEKGILEAADAQGRNRDVSFGAGGLLGVNVGLGGQYSFSDSQIMLTPMMLISTMLNRPEADEGIINMTGTSGAYTLIGEPAILIHEFGHHVDWTLRNTLYGALWERRKRGIQAFANDPNKNTSPDVFKEFVRQQVEEFRDELRTYTGIVNPNKPSEIHGASDRQNVHRARLKQIGTTVRRMSPDEVPVGTRLFNPATLTDEELDEKIAEIAGQLDEAHGLTTLLTARQQGAQNPTNIGNASTNSPEPYVTTPYGNSNTVERFAEITAFVLSRNGQKQPVAVNNAAVLLWARILGVSVEPQDTVSQSRRKKLPTGGYSDEMEDITNRIISDIKIVAPDVERQPDGHRPGLQSSTSSSDFRFNPDERSMLRSRSNIGIDTDERLYAQDEPIGIMDFINRPRVYSIGDHHFYDNEVRYGSQIGFALRQRLGEQAGRRFTNRNRPHHGDLVRAVSATQFGMFIDDLPTYDTTTAGQLEVLRGFVTGKIARLRPEQRSQIEEALRDATRIHAAIYGATPNKRDTYRAVKIDRETFLESIAIGDEIPMPITSFSPDKPDNSESVVIKLEKGAKTLEVGNRQVLTQGNFEVVSIDDDGTRVMATLRHKETFDPRHDALRPVDRFSDKPNAMRKMGSYMPRYTKDEQQKMEVDLERRKERAAVFGLRSTTGRVPEDLSDKEIDEFLDEEVNLFEEKRVPKAIVDKAKKRLRDYIAQNTARRFSKAKQALIQKYGTDKPWERDADAIRKWRAIDKETAARVSTVLRRSLVDALWNRTRDMVNVDTGELFDDTKVGSARIVERFGYYINDYEGIDLSAGQIKHLLETGQFVYWRRDDELFPTEKMVINLPINSPEMAELKQVLETTLPALEAMSRAYLLDGSANVPNANRSIWEDPKIGGQIVHNNEEWNIVPNGKGVYAVFQPDGSESVSLVVNASFGVGRTQHNGTTGFTRKVGLDRDGNIVVGHDRFWMGSKDRARKSSGVATLFNQHSFLWWKQHEGTEVVVPNAVSDGVLVWPRQGFRRTDQTRRQALSEQSDFFQIVRALVLKAKRPELFEANWADDGTSSDEGAKFVRLIDDINGQYGLDNPEFAKRLINWLALARETNDSQSPETDLINILANIIEPRELTETQLLNWSELFDQASNHNTLGMFLNRDDNDNDYLPSFVIPDPTDDTDPIEVQRQIERGRLLRQELENSQAPSQVERDIYFPEDDPENPGARLLGERQAGRLFAAVNIGNTTSSSDTRTFSSARAFMYSREGSGFNVPPQLLTRVETEERISQGQIPLYGWIDLSRIGSSETYNRQELYEQRVRNNLVGLAGPSEVMRFTDKPFEHIDDFYDINNPIDDPASVRSGMLGYLAPWARIYKGRPNGLTRLFWGDSTEVSIARDMRDRQDFDGLMRSLINKFGGEYESNIMGDDVVIVQAKEASLPSGDSDASKSARRILAAVFQVENNRRMAEAGIATAIRPDRIQGLRDGLLAIMATEFDQSLLVMLGYDAIQHSDGEFTVLNNMAVELMDEPVSFAQAARMIDDPRYRSIPSDRSRYSQFIKDRVVDNPDWFSGDDPRLLDDQPIALTRGGIRSSTYIRSVRQDHNINLESKLGRKRGLASRTREVRRREEAREGKPNGWVNPDDASFRQEVLNLEGRFNALFAQLEEWDNRNMELDSPDWAGRDAIKKQIDEIADQFVSLINTSNTVIEKAMEHQALIDALDAIINERDADFLDGRPKVKDVSPEMLDKMRALRDKLIEEKENNPGLLDFARARARHKTIKKALENFDLQFEVRWFNDEQVPVELDDVNKADIADKAETFLEHIYRGLFDERYDAWLEDKKPTMAFGVPLYDTTWAIGHKRVGELFDGIGPEQRDAWRAAHKEFLDNEYNAEYEEDIIEATPVSGSTRPRDVPAPVWRKVRAAMLRARSTPYNGEKEAATNAAIRLLNPHRPDLANEDFVSGIRSQTVISTPRSVVNFSSKQMRGASPTSPTTAIENHPFSRIIDEVRSQGIEIDEADLLPTGKYGSKLRQIMDNNESTQSVNWLIRQTEDDPVLSAIVNAAIKQARLTMGITPIEGHRIKKVNGPVDEEIADVLVDDIDLALLRNQGAPTYDQIIQIAAAKYIEHDRLNKAFGSYQDPEGKLIGAGFTVINKNSTAYLTTMTSAPDVDGKDYVYRDIRGNEVARLKGYSSVKSDNAISRKPKTLSNFATQHSLIKTNDAIFGVMAEAVEFAGDYENASLKKIRATIEELQSIYRNFEFAPTPAGQHLKKLFEANLESEVKTLELLERIGQRYVHLLRERGVSDKEIREMLSTVKKQKLKTAVDPVGRKDLFLNGSPIPIGSSTDGTVAEQALYGFLNSKLGSAMLPRFADSDAPAGFHEIGHFSFGQAFSRHGEFVANAWPFFVHGDAFWRSFVALQRNQAPTFDKWTISEHLGKALSPEQKAAFKNAQIGTLSRNFVSSFYRERYLSLGNSEREKIASDVIAAVRDNGTLGDKEKEELITQIQKEIDGDMFFIGVTSPRKYSDEEKKFLRELGLPEDAAPDDGKTVGTWKLYEPLIPLNPSVFGWQRRDGLSSTTAERQKLKDDVVEHVLAGNTVRATATKFNVSPETVARYLRQAGVPNLGQRPIGIATTDDSYGETGKMVRADAPDVLKAKFDVLTQMIASGADLRKSLESINFSGVDIDYVIDFMDNLPELPERWSSDKGPFTDNALYRAISLMAALGFSTRLTSEQLGKSPSTITKYRKHSGFVPPKIRGGGPTRGLNSTTATSQQRREFATLLRSVHSLMGGRPVFFGNETDEEMAIAERSFRQKRAAAKRRLSPIIDALRGMAQKYPELGKDFADELKEIYR